MVEPSGANTAGHRGDGGGGRRAVVWAQRGAPAGRASCASISIALSLVSDALRGERGIRGLSSLQSIPPRLPFCGASRSGW